MTMENLSESVTPAVRPPSSQSGWSLAAGQFRRNRAATAGLLLLLALVIVAAAAPLLAPYNPIQIKLSAKLLAPSLSHLLGTDHFGRDVLSRMIWGARVSLSVGLIVVAFSMVIGIPIGLAAGYLGGRVDNLLMRITDAFLTFPPLLLGIAVVGLLGPDLQNVMLALGIVQVPVLARVVRSSTLAVRNEPYITAMRALGASTGRILLKHVLMNILSAIVVQLTIGFSTAVIAEASLSFLGLGTQPPQPSWGRDLADARRFMADAPWMFLAPTGAIVLCVMAINFIGDGLRDALDPRSWQPRRRAPRKED